MTAAALVLTALGTQIPAAAAPLFGEDDLQRNGAVSRHYWKPNFAEGRAGGVHFSAGLAIGLKDAARTQLQRSVAPALVMDLGPRSSVSLLPAGGRGAMIMLQTQL